MEQLTANKAETLKRYNAASEETKETLRAIFGAEAFKFDYRSIKTYGDACRHLGMREHLITGTPDCDKEALQMASAAYKLVVICKALNNGQPYDEDGTTWCPIYWFYTKDELAEMGEKERKAKGIKLLSAAGANSAEDSGVRCANTYHRCAHTNADFGFPLVLNSKDKAEYIAEQFEALIFQCYGIKVKEEAGL